MLVKGLQSHSEFVQFRQGGLSQLAPPYRTVAVWVQAAATSTPLGTIVHGCGPSALAVLGSVALAVRSCPWLVPVITLPPDEERLQPLVEVVGELRNRVAIVP